MFLRNWRGRRKGREEKRRGRGREEERERVREAIVSFWGRKDRSCGSLILLVIFHILILLYVNPKIILVAL